MAKSDVAVIILTFNEERNISAAIDSVAGWAKEIFVVDSYSTDNTVKLALARQKDGVRVVQHEFIDYSSQWNWALQNLPIGATWTLKLDADERVTKEFKREFEILASKNDGELEGIYFRRQIFFMGKPLRWGGMTENYDLRMWRSGAAVFENRSVNEHALVNGKTAFIKAFVEHHDYKSISHWLDRHNRYSSMEANILTNGRNVSDIEPRFFGSWNQRRLWLRSAYQAIPWRALWYFLYRFVVRLGFLDGKVGFRYAFLHSSYMYWIDLKSEETRRTDVPADVLWPQRGVASANAANIGTPSTDATRAA